MPGSSWNGHLVPRDATVAELQAMLERDAPDCWVAFKALGQSRDPAAFKLLALETESPDEFRRRAALEALAESPLRLEAREQVRRLLNDPSPFVVRTALLAAAAFPEAELHDIVLQFLAHADPRTRETAVSALGYLWRGDDFEVVLNRMTEDVDADVRKEAAWVLAHRARSHSRTLIDRWRSSPLPRERVWACELIAESEGRQYRTILESLVRDSDGHVRDAARRTLATFDNQDAR